MPACDGLCDHQKTSPFNQPFYSAKFEFEFELDESRRHSGERALIPRKFEFEFELEFLGVSVGVGGRASEVLGGSLSWHAFV